MSSEDQGESSPSNPDEPEPDEPPFDVPNESVDDAADEENESWLFADVPEDNVFRSRSKLSESYIPEREGIKHRDEQIEKIKERYANRMVNTGMLPDLSVFSGDNGTGKSLLAEHLGEQMKLQLGDDLRVLKTNCAECTTEHQVAIAVGNQILPPDEQMSKHGLNQESVIDNLFTALENVEQDHVLIILDEVGQIEDINNILYQVCRSGQSGTILDTTDVGLITTSNSLKFYNTIKNKRPDVYSSLDKNEVIKFEPYNASEMQDILEHRVKVSLYPDVINESAWVLAAAFAAQKGGDARYGIQLLNQAGSLVISAGEEPITEDDIRKAKRIVDQNWIEAEISDYSLKQQFALLPLIENEYYEMAEDEAMIGNEVAARQKELGEKWDMSYYNPNKIYNPLGKFEQGELTQTEHRGRTRRDTLLYEPERYLEAMDDELVEKALGLDDDVEGIIDPAVLKEPNDLNY